MLYSTLCASSRGAHTKIRKLLHLSCKTLGQSPPASGLLFIYKGEENQLLTAMAHRGQDLAEWHQPYTDDTGYEVSNAILQPRQLLGQ